MSFSSIDLKKYRDEIILKEAAIHKRIVVLCEGYSENIKSIIENPLTIGEFSKLYQDASFYQNAVPTWWRKTGKDDPIFYICGRQSDVIETYFYLKEKYQEKEDKRLDINKLFALIDIDLQSKPLRKDYPFKYLEAIYHDLYVNGQVNQTTAKNHKIWVTGLLHKEAYFIIPELQELFNSHQPIFNNLPVNELEDLYKKIAHAMSNDKDDIKIHFSAVKNRIKHHEDLYNSLSINDFQTTWLDKFSNSELTIEEKQALVYALLTLAKSKPIWEKIKSPNESINHKTYRDELSFEIAREFYAKQPRDSQHHLPSFFNALSAMP